MPLYPNTFLSEPHYALLRRMRKNKGTLKIADIPTTGRMASTLVRRDYAKWLRDDKGRETALQITALGILEMERYFSDPINKFLRSPPKV